MSAIGLIMDVLLGGLLVAALVFGWRLERKLKALFPRLDTRAEFAWCGSFGFSTTGMPAIGAIPGLPNCYAAMGYGGNGITFAMIAAQILRGLITGTGDADTDLVSLRS